MRRVARSSLPISDLCGESEAQRGKPTGPSTALTHELSTRSSAGLQRTPSSTRLAPYGGLPSIAHPPDVKDVLAYLDNLKDAFEINTKPNVDDRRFISAIVDAHNAVNAEQKLEFHHFEASGNSQSVLSSKLIERLTLSLRRGEEFRAILADDSHAVAMSAKPAQDASSISLIIIDSREIIPGRLRNWSAAMETVAQSLTQRMGGSASLAGTEMASIRPVRVQCTLLDPHIQETQDGCFIFALSAARKIALCSAIGNLHNAALSRRPDHHRSHVSKADPTTTLNPSFYEDTTSARVLGRYLAHLEDPEKANDLRERFLAHLTVRPKAAGASFNLHGKEHIVHAAEELARLQLSNPDDEGPTHDLGKDVRVFSRSYEARRIEVFSQLLDHLQAQERK